MKKLTKGQSIALDFFLSCYDEESSFIALMTYIRADEDENFTDKWQVPEAYEDWCSCSLADEIEFLATQIDYAIEQELNEFRKQGAKQ